MLECSDKTFYCGYTPDLEKRLKTHQTGKGAKYTKARLPVTLRYFEVLKTKSDAMKREAEIKKLSRWEKAELIKKFEEL